MEWLKSTYFFSVTVMVVLTDLFSFTLVEMRVNIDKSELISYYAMHWKHCHFLKKSVLRNAIVSVN